MSLQPAKRKQKSKEQHLINQTTSTSFMKSMPFFSTLALIGSVCCSSCKETSIAQETVILIDITDTAIQQFDTTGVNNVSIMDDSPLNGETTKVVTISDVAVNNHFEASIPIVTRQLYSNTKSRKKMVNEYFSKLNTIIGNVTEQDKGKDASVIYKRIAEELNILTDKQAVKKTMIINSDLMEKSFINFYKESVFEMMITNPDTVYNKLIGKYPLKDLTGIEIFILFQPKNVEESERFEVVSTFYKHLFESHGAIALIQSNI